MQYDLAGRRTSLTFASGLLRGFTYDAASQTVSIIDTGSGGSSLARWTFGYDAVGNRLVVRDNAGAWTTYSYDAKNQLTQDATALVNTHTYNYGYDGVGNRLTSNEGGMVMTSTYDAANRLVTSVDGSGPSTYTFDSNGNMTKVAAPSSVTTMVYDIENRLVRHESGGVTTTYTYQGSDGLKRSEQVGAARTTIIWDGDEYLQERN
jgi:YD repeat-containing protein